MENGKATVIGLTTLNPYQSINMAIRSRCHLYEVKNLESDDLEKALQNAIRFLEIDIKIHPDAIKTITQFSNHEVRSALNLLESASLSLQDGDILTANMVRKVAGKPQLSLDQGEDHYYQMLSALQKSIRGSDVDPSLHYLARLITLGDLEIIFRRLMVIAYEDIGLANPTMGMKVYTACEVARKLGFPEARIPLSVVVIDMALSPKSNTAYSALDLALADFEAGITGEIPKHVNNRQLKITPDIYHYPHQDPGSVNDQTYLPDKIKKKKYYQPKQESVYEKALSERKKFIDKLKNYE